MPIENESKVGIIILAAGSSSRLGEPKQLLQYKGENLLQHHVKVALESSTAPVVVVLGANAEQLINEVDDKKVRVIINSDHKEGMASSIIVGLKALTELSPGIHAVIIMVCDQPYVTASLLNNLVATHLQTGKPIVTSGYQNTFGPPALFHKSLFNELLQLYGDVGARKVVQQHWDKAEVVVFEKGSIDIDTFNDYKKLLDEEGEK